MERAEFDALVADVKANGLREPITLFEGRGSPRMSADEWICRCPYGWWTCADGRQVIFNRQYWPILERRPGEPPKPADPCEAVAWRTQEYIWVDATFTAAELCARVNAVLRAWGLPTLPPRRPIPHGDFYEHALSKNPDRRNPWAYPFGEMPKRIPPCTTAGKRVRS
jgi:hypothetical protein